MPLVALICASLLGFADDAVPPVVADVAAEYRQAKANLGRTAGDQVHLALWCEAHGLTAERVRHLALAVLADPTNATARGLLGLVARDGRWLAPQEVAQTVRRDDATTALLSEYDLKRSRTPYTADAQWSLGQWADEQGLKDQARAHYTAVTRLDPSRELAWKRLGYKKHDGHWITDAQLASAKAEADAQKKADHTWKPLLEKWRGMLDKPSRQEEARAALLTVTDPRALPSIARVFINDRPADQQVAVGLLGQVASPQASKFLAALAVFPSAPDVRRTALETLRQRDPRDFLSFWIALIRTPIKYEVHPVGGPGSPGTLLIVGEKSNNRRIYRPLNAPNPADYPGMVLTYGPDGQPSLVQREVRGYRGVLNGVDQSVEITNVNQITPLNFNGPPVSLSEAMEKLGSAVQTDGKSLVTAATGAQVRTVNNIVGVGGTRNYAPVVATRVEIPIGRMMQDAEQSAQVASVQLASDVAKIDVENARTRNFNEPILNALHQTTGQDFGEEKSRWDRWWIDQQGYALTDSSTNPTPTLVENVPIGFTPTAAPIVTNQLIGTTRAGFAHSCFAAGTAVRTVDGTKLIETIQRGDMVLVQDTLSGSLSYQPVLTAFHNPPSSTYRIKLREDEVVATGIHRFWKAGKGWTMARDLKVGDSLRVLGGVATVEAVEPNQTQPVFNLEVADGRSFFVGRVGALVHDNSLVEATPNPFDAAGIVGPVAAATGGSGPR